jgi:hypothetical protein
MADRTPAQIYALVFGAVLLIAGIIGFFYSAAFGSPGDVDGVFGVLDVNGWHNVVHILSGVVGLAVAGSYSNARLYALGFGAIYIVVAILGFIYGDGDSIFDLIPINTEDNVLHALIGVAGIGAGMATPAEPAPTTAATAP